LLDQRRIRERRLRILVERLQVRVRRGRVEEVVALLDVLAVIALGTSEAEQPLLQDRIAAVPERQREADARLAIADAEEPVLAPAIRAAARVIVGEVVPARAPLGVVLADGAPLALGEIRPPALPVHGPPAVLVEASGLGIGRSEGA